MRAGMIALAGALIILDLAGVRLIDRPTLDVSQQELSVNGYVCGPAEPTAGGSLAFVFCVHRTGATGFYAPLRVRLMATGDRERSYYSGPMRIRFKPRPARAPLNAGGGGYEDWLYQQRIHATGRVVEAQRTQGECQLGCRYHRWRIGLIENLSQHLSRMRHPELAEALLLGSRARLEKHHWETLRATGTQHLMAISGLHIGLVAVMLSYLCFPVFAYLSPQYPFACRWFAFALVMAGTAFYALLAGFSVPTQRALVMVGVAGILVVSGRQWRLWDAWLWALLAVILLEPRAVLGMGFWFSFGAVACLVMAFGARLGHPGFAGSLLLAQVAVVAGLLPLLTAFDAQPSLLALPSNLLIIPLFSLVVMPLLLMAAPFVLSDPTGAAWVEPGLDLLLGVMWSLLDSLASLDWHFPELPFAAPLLLALGALAALMPLGRDYRVVMLATAIMVLLLPTPDSGNGEKTTEIRFPDGFGGAVALIRDGDTTLLFDARSPALGYREYNRDRLIPWLQTLGIDELDALVLSHPGVRPDHHWRFADAPVIRQVLEADACDRVQRFETSRLRLVGWRDPRGETLPIPERGCSLRIRAGDFEALLFGPIGRSGERRLLRWLERPGRIDLVLAPRGGRAGSSQRGLIEALQPRWAVISPRRWSAQAPPAHARYRQAGVEALLTPRTGELRLKLVAGRPQLEKARNMGWWWPLW